MTYFTRTAAASLMKLFFSNTRSKIFDVTSLILQALPHLFIFLANIRQVGEDPISEKRTGVLI